ncbi:ABC transporter substrate-binding protein [Winogradskyella sp. DF17]|uniref:Thiamine pyrimidine synthase n=1 Tax=Winogradskyella pelagia TaxID=2819984 RepID=A0ABS3T4K9_9FLAO|nr:ABC transporter substrate-binding protein [Winogradskyella sp. DF17]MBO3117688.1 ABC transporter substrate-binding protein [Winogradskyella sp. DF17]
METLKLALDWRPNTNHTGFFVAKHLGFYEEEDLNLHIISTEEDNYAMTPAKKVELGLVHFALCPMETLVSYRTKANPFDAIAIATIFQEDISAICALKSRGIKRPKDLDNHIYASYKARYEDKIVQQMIKNDKGKGDIILKYPEKLGIWNTLLNGKADATWIFVNWEGVEAEAQGIELNLFRMSDYGIPYGYSPVIMTSQSQLEEQQEVCRSFLRATKRGFQYAISHVESAAQILDLYVSKADKYVDLVKSQIMTSPSYGKPDSWGEMDLDKIQSFLDWLRKNRLERTKFKATDLVTNELFERL